MTPTHEPPMDQDLTPRVRDWLRETALAGPDAARGLDKLLDDFPTTPQRRRWWRIAWPNRGRDVSRSVTGRGTTSHGRSSAMFGPFRLAVASVILVIVGGFALIRLAEPSPPPLLLAGATLVVAPDGTGDFTTISAAVAAAADGDIIQVRPGHYLESVAVVGKDLTIVGVGDRNAIIVEATLARLPVSVAAVPASAPPDAAPVNWALLLLDTSSTVSNMTILGQEVGTAIHVSGVGSAPILEDVVVRVNGAWTGDHQGIMWYGGAGGALRNSFVDGWTEILSNAGVVIEDNDMTTTCIALWTPGARATIRRNVIRGCPYEFGITIEQGSAVIEGNDISAAEGPPGTDSLGRVGIVLNSGEATTVVADNDVHDSLTGISAGSMGVAEISGNLVVGNRLGVSAASSEIVLSDNTVTGNSEGVLISAGSPTLTGNTITGNESGLRIGGASPTLTGNTICDNGVNLSYGGLGEPPPTEGNEICADTPSAEPGTSPDASPES